MGNPDDLSRGDFGTHGGRGLSTALSRPAAPTLPPWAGQCPVGHAPRRGAGTDTPLQGHVTSFASGPHTWTSMLGFPAARSSPEEALLLWPRTLNGSPLSMRPQTDSDLECLGSHFCTLPTLILMPGMSLCLWPDALGREFTTLPPPPKEPWRSEAMFPEPQRLLIGRYRKASYISGSQRPI